MSNQYCVIPAHCCIRTLLIKGEVTSSKYMYVHGRRINCHLIAGHFGLMHRPLSAAYTTVCTVRIWRSLHSAVYLLRSICLTGMQYLVYIPGSLGDLLTLLLIARCLHHRGTIWHQAVQCADTQCAGCPVQ